MSFIILIAAINPQKIHAQITGDAFLFNDQVHASAPAACGHKLALVENHVHQKIGHFTRDPNWTFSDIEHLAIRLTSLGIAYRAAYQSILAIALKQHFSDFIKNFPWMDVARQQTNVKAQISHFLGLNFFKKLSVTDRHTLRTTLQKALYEEEKNILAIVTSAQEQNRNQYSALQEQISFNKAGHEKYLSGKKRIYNLENSIKISEAKLIAKQELSALEKQALLYNKYNLDLELKRNEYYKITSNKYKAARFQNLMLRASETDLITNELIAIEARSLANTHALSKIAAKYLVRAAASWGLSAGLMILPEFLMQAKEPTYTSLAAHPEEWVPGVARADTLAMICATYQDSPQKMIRAENALYKAIEEAATATQHQVMQRIELERLKHLPNGGLPIQTQVMFPDQTKK